jgi:hypothetical protein
LDFGCGSGTHAFPADKMVGEAKAWLESIVEDDTTRVLFVGIGVNWGVSGEMSPDDEGDGDASGGGAVAWSRQAAAGSKGDRSGC